ncbi:Transcriptional regulator [Escherichia coli]
MLPGCCKNGIVISKIPVMQAGLKEVMRTHFPEYEIISSASAEDLTLLQLRRSGLVIADLAGESEDPRSVCEHYYSLISQYREIHWVFMMSRSWYSQAVELLGNDSNLLIVFYVQIMPDDFVMQLHRF